MGSGPLAFLEGANNFSTITKNTGKRFWGVGAVLGVWGRGGGKGRMSIMARCLTRLLLLRRRRKATTQHNQPLRRKKARGLQLSQSFRSNFNHRTTSSSSLSLLLPDSPRLPVNKKQSFSSSFPVGYTTLPKDFFSTFHTERLSAREREREVSS
jgi:hypothetical protein